MSDELNGGCPTPGRFLPADQQMARVAWPSQHSIQCLFVTRPIDAEENAYFVRLGPHCYSPTEHAGGTWREDELHLAPVAGLVVHEMERWRQAHLDPAMRFSRFSFELLGQIPRGTIEMHTEVVRPGRTIELIETTMTIGRVIIRGRAWLLSTEDTSAVAGSPFGPLPDPETQPDFRMSDIWPGGFIASLRGKRVGPVEPGRGCAWLTTDVELVTGEPVSPLASFCALVDAANGIAIRQKPTDWMYPNVEWTVHLFTQPQGRWVGLDTRVSFGPDGLGLTSSVLHDLRGPVGMLQQSLTVRPLHT